MRLSVRFAAVLYPTKRKLSWPDVYVCLRRSAAALFGDASKDATALDCQKNAHGAAIPKSTCSRITTWTSSLERAWLNFTGSTIYDGHFWSTNACCEPIAKDTGLLRPCASNRFLPPTNARLSVHGMSFTTHHLRHLRMKAPSHCNHRLRLLNLDSRQLMRSYQLGRPMTYVYLPDVISKSR